MIGIAAAGLGAYEGRLAAKATRAQSISAQGAGGPSDAPDSNSTAQAPLPSTPPRRIVLKQDRPAVSLPREFKNVGNGTPTETVETLNWAGDTGNVGALSKLIAFSPAGQLQIEEAFAGLSAAEKARYSIATPGDLAANLLFGLGPRFFAVKTPKTGQSDENQATGPMAFQGNDEGFSAYQFTFKHTAAGWQWLIPDTVVAGITSRLRQERSSDSGAK